MLIRDPRLVDRLQVGVQIELQVETSISNWSTTATQYLRSTLGAVVSRVRYSFSTEAKSIYIRGIKSTMLGCSWYQWTKVPSSLQHTQSSSHHIPKTRLPLLFGRWYTPCARPHIFLGRLSRRPRESHRREYRVR